MECSTCLDLNHMVINDECICCGECKAVCPYDAISDGEQKYVVDSTKCDIRICMGSYGFSHVCTYVL